MPSGSTPTTSSFPGLLIYTTIQCTRCLNHGTPGNCSTTGTNGAHLRSTSRKFLRQLVTYKMIRRVSVISPSLPKYRQSRVGPPRSQARSFSDHSVRLFLPAYLDSR